MPFIYQQILNLYLHPIHCSWNSNSYPQLLTQHFISGVYISYMSTCPKLNSWPSSPESLPHISWAPISMDAVSIFQFAQAKNLKSFMILLLCSCPPSNTLGSSWLYLQTISRRWLFSTTSFAITVVCGTTISPAWASSNAFCFYSCPTASRMSLASHIPFLASSSARLVHFISATPGYSPNTSCLLLSLQRLLPLPGMLFPWDPG